MRTRFTLLLAACVLSQAGATIIFQAEPPQVPKELPLVQLAPWPLSRSLAMRRASEFGLEKPVFVKSPRGLLLSSGPLILSQDALGVDFFADTSRFMAEPAGEKDPLPDADAVKAAMSFFQRHPGRASADGVALHRVAHLMNQGQDLRSGDMTPATIDENIVYFKRMIAGVPVVPVEGPADQVRVHVDNLGNVTGQYQLWRNASITKEVLPILPYLEVRDMFIRRLTQEMGDSKSDALVTRIEFGYFGRPEGSEQGFFQPAYLFYVGFQEPNEKSPTSARILVMPGVDPKLLKEPLEPPMPPLEGGSEANIRFKANPPQLPGGLPTFQVTPTPVNTDLLLRRAAQLQLGDGSVVPTPRGLAFDSKQFLLFQDEAGAEFLANKARMLNEPPGEGQPLPDDQVIKMALEYVASLQDVSPGDLGTPVVRHLMQQTFDTSNQKPGPVTIDEAIVEFPRVLHSATGAPVPCIGPGAFFNVHIDNRGNPTGHNRVWRAVSDPLKTTELRPFQQINMEFIRQLTSELGSSLADVVDIHYGLYFRPPGVRQGMLLPAVQYDVDIVDPATGEVTAHRQLFIPAGPDLPEPLDNPEDQIQPNDPTLLDDRGSSGIPAAYGDLNRDGKVDSEDVKLCLLIAGGQTAPDDPGVVTAGDVSPSSGFPGGNGRLETGDALRILRSIYGLDDISSGP